MRAFYLFIVFSILNSCSNEYLVEDELYEFIEGEFSNQGLDLKNTLDTLEQMYLDQELIESTSAKSYRNYYQKNIDEGMLLSLQDYYLTEVKSKVELSYYDLERSALRKYDGVTFDESKFGKISNSIDKQTIKTGQITCGTVAKAHLDFLSVDDFNHPFYRANILLSLQYIYYQKYMLMDRNYLKEIPNKIDFEHLWIPFISFLCRLIQFFRSKKIVL